MWKDASELCTRWDPAALATQPAAVPADAASRRATDQRSLSVKVLTGIRWDPLIVGSGSCFVGSRKDEEARRKGGEERRI